MKRLLGSREGVRDAVARGMGIGFGFDLELGHQPPFRGIRIRGYERSNVDMLLCLKAQRQPPLVAALFAAACEVFPSF